MFLLNPIMEGVVNVGALTIGAAEEDVDSPVESEVRACVQAGGVGSAKLWVQGNSSCKALFLVWVAQVVAGPEMDTVAIQDGGDHIQVLDGS